MSKNKTHAELIAENEELKIRLFEAEETLNAIRTGEVDALVVSGPIGDQIFTLKGANRGYRTLVEEMNEGAAILTSDGTIFYSNSRLANMVDIPLERMTGNSMDTFIPQEDRGMYEALFKKGLRGNSSGEIKLIKDKKDSLPVYVSMQNLKTGDIEGICITVTDLSQQKRNEEIMESERLSRCILEQAGEYIIVCDKNGVIIRSSKVVNKLCNCNPILYYFDNIFNLQYKNKQNFSVLSVLENKSVKQSEVTLKQKDNRVFNLLINAKPIKNPNKEIIGCVITLADITELKRAEEEVIESRNNLEFKVQERTNELFECNIRLESDIEEINKMSEALRESEEKFKALAENSPDIISRFDKELRYMYVNHNSDTLGLQPENIIGKKLEEISPSQDLTSLWVENSKKAIDTGKIQEMEYIFNSVHGMKIFYSYIVPEFNVKGEVESLIAVSHNITERKQLEESLKETVEELKRSNAELQQFAYAASHDLQEPLRTIASFTQLLERRYRDQLDSDADEFMDYIIDAAKRMQQLINDLLEYSRVTTRAKEFKSTDTEKIIENVISNLHEAIKESNARISYASLPEVMADERQLAQLFQNLISNAIKFRKPDVTPKIHISAKKDDQNNEYVFSVSDNGIGIEPQYFDRIFTIFQRLHTREEYTGTGIGLAVSRKVIERHGGHIWVESDPGKGSTFYFTLPIKPITNI